MVAAGTLEGTPATSRLDHPDKVPGPSGIQVLSNPRTTASGPSLQPATGSGKDDFAGNPTQRPWNSPHPESGIPKQPQGCDRPVSARPFRRGHRRQRVREKHLVKDRLFPAVQSALQRTSGKPAKRPSEPGTVTGLSRSTPSRSGPVPIGRPPVLLHPTWACLTTSGNSSRVPGSEVARLLAPGVLAQLSPGTVRLRGQGVFEAGDESSPHRANPLRGAGGARFNPRNARSALEWQTVADVWR